MLKTLITLLIHLTFIDPAIASKKELKIVASHWPPFAIETKKGAKGISVDILKESLGKEGYTFKILFLPWTRVLKTIKEHKADIGFPAYYSKKRANSFTFSPAFFSTPLSLWKLKNFELNSTKINDLTGHTIGVVRGYINTPEIDNSKKLKLAAVNTDKQNILKLIKNRISLAVIDDFVASYIIQNQLDQKNQGRVVPIKPPLTYHSLHLLLPKHARSEGILKDFNKGLKRIKENGVYDKIILKYKKRLRL